MAITPQILGKNLAQQPDFISIDTSNPLYTPKFNEGKNSLDSDKIFSRYFAKIHKKYPGINTDIIEKLVNMLLKDKDSIFMNIVREKTSLNDTFSHRFFEIKTPLGQVLKELQNAQESPNRRLLSEEILNKAELEAKELIKNKEIFVKEKGKQLISNEFSQLQKRSTTIQKIGSEFQVNSYTTNYQSLPSIATLSNGQFVITWQSLEQDGEGLGIYGQIFNTDGSKSGSEFLVNTYTTNWQQMPSVAALRNGQFIVTWESYGQDGAGLGIYGQIFNTDGSKRGSEFLVNTYTTNWQQRPSVVVLWNGQFIVTWESLGQDGNGWGIYGQIFNTDGSKNGSEFQVNTYTTSDQGIPSVTALSTGQFVVTWQSLEQDGDGNGIYGQRFNTDGSKSGSEFQVNTYTTSDQINPSVAALSNGQFIVAWQSFGQDGDIDGIYGQIFNTDGSKSGSEFQVNTYIRSDQQNPSVAALNNGQFVVTWQSQDLFRDRYGFGIFGQIFNTDGSKRGSEFQVNTYTTNSQRYPSVAALNNGQFVVTWQSLWQDGDAEGIYGQIFEVQDISTTSSSSTISTYTSTSELIIRTVAPTTSSIYQTNTNPSYSTTTIIPPGSQTTVSSIYQTNTNPSYSRTTTILPGSQTTASSIYKTNTNPSYSRTTTIIPPGSQTTASSIYQTNTNPSYSRTTIIPPGSQTTASSIYQTNTGSSYSRTSTSKSIIPSGSQTTASTYSTIMRSGADKQATGLAIIALSWMLKTIKGFFGILIDI